MKKYAVQTGTVTYAIKGRDLLRRNGFRAGIERGTSSKNSGCGYSVVVEGDIDTALSLLKDAGIKILGVREK